MRMFLGRFFGWYLWLGCYAAAIGALVGMLCFSGPLLPFLLLLFFVIYPPALAFAAPLNLFILPVAFHLLRENPKRALWLRITGVLGGFVSPTIAVLALIALDWKFPGSMRNIASRELSDVAASMAMFSVVGSIAGLACARIFNKHGDKASIFDVNGQLAALREQQSSARSAGSLGSGTP
jgi:hypothetical protein